MTLYAPVESGGISSMRMWVFSGSITPGPSTTVARLASASRALEKLESSGSLNSSVTFSGDCASTAPVSGSERTRLACACAGEV